VGQQHALTRENDQHHRLRSILRGGVLVCMSAAVAFAAACKGRGSDAGVSTAWAPIRGEAVMGVPAASLVGAIEATLATRPETMTPSR
jgi:hypothetical protein